MAGTTTITIDGKIWTATLATSMSELLAGLSGVESIPANTGMLFDFGSDQAVINVNMDDMLFSLDIVFINSAGGVVGVLHDVAPEEIAVFNEGVGLGARYFLEVNAGEAVDVNVGDTVTIGAISDGNGNGNGDGNGTTDGSLDINSLISPLITIMIVMMMMKMMTGAMTGVVKGGGP